MSSGEVLGFEPVGSTAAGANVYGASSSSDVVGAQQHGHGYGHGAGQGEREALQREQEDDETATTTFTLGHVQFELASALHTLRCTNNTLVLILSGSSASSRTGTSTSASTGTGIPPQIVWIDLDNPEQVNRVDMPASSVACPLPSPFASSSSSRHRAYMHVDPTARHVLVCAPSSSASGPASATSGTSTTNSAGATAQGHGQQQPSAQYETHYIYIGPLPPATLSPTTVSAIRRPKVIAKLKGQLVQAVGWNRTSIPSAAWARDPASANAGAVPSGGGARGGARATTLANMQALYGTREILLGTAGGQILECSIIDPTLLSAATSSSASGLGETSASSAFKDLIPGRSGGGGGGGGGSGAAIAVERIGIKHLFTLPRREAVESLECYTWLNGSRALVLASTRSSIAQFISNAPSSASSRGVASLPGRVPSSKQPQGADDDLATSWAAVFAPYLSGEIQPKTLDLGAASSSSSAAQGAGARVALTELHTWARANEDMQGHTTGLSLPKAMAWMAGPGIYHGKLAMQSDKLTPGEGIIDEASLVPYPMLEPARPTHVASPSAAKQAAPATTTPLSMALTEWHFVLLFPDRIIALGILSDRVVWNAPLLHTGEDDAAAAEEEALLAPGERPIRLASDPVQKTLWLYSTQAIYEVIVSNDDADVWKIYLNRQNFTLAFEHAKTARQKGAVLAAEADSYFNAGRYIQAAQSYAKSSKPFEDVVLRFIDEGERDALRYFLVAKLERTPRPKRTQRMLLATWLVEIYLAKLNHLDDLLASTSLEGSTSEEEGGGGEAQENVKLEKAIVDDELRDFLRTYRDALDKRTVFQLIDSHARDDVMLHFAELEGAHDRIVTHWVVHQDWTHAIDALARQDDPELYYRFAPVSMRHQPAKMAEALRRRTDLDVRRLLPALAAPLAFGATPEQLEHSTRYLQHVVTQQGSTDPVVHNALVALLATNVATDNTALMRFLKSAPLDPATRKPYYDLDYALRTCRANARVHACVLIYAKMRRFESSVDLALEHDELELAKENADMPVDNDLLRKKLWLKIAKHVVSKKHDIKAAMRFIESTDLLNIEDVLPFFPDFVVIDDFKEEICAALEGYASQIDKLKLEMDDAARSAELIKSDIDGLGNRFVVVDAAEKCALCRELLLTRQFYVFPCQHAFHGDCFIDEAKGLLSPAQLRRVLALQAKLAPAQHKASSKAQSSALAAIPYGMPGLDQLRKLVLPDALLSSLGNALPVRGVFTGGTGGGADEQESTRAYLRPRATSAAGANGSADSEERRALGAQLDEILASACVLCERAVLNIDRPFVSPGEVDL